MTEIESSRFSVIIVLHDSADTVATALSSLPSDAEIVVVDNASTDEPIRIIERLRPDTHYVRLEANRGFGAGCNHGAQVATGDVFVFLNPDTTVRRGAIERLVAAVRDDPMAVFGPALLDTRGQTMYVCRRRSIPLHEIVDLVPLAGRLVPLRWRRNLPPHARLYRTGGTVDYLQGACMAISRQLFERVGGFDETFILYSEEEDLCDRVRAVGGQCVYEPTAAIVHEWGTSTAKTGTWAERQRYRSCALLYRKRYGRVGGGAAAIAIGTAVVARLALWPVARLVGRQDRRGPNWAIDCLRGLASATAIPAGVRPVIREGRP